MGDLPEARVSLRSPLRQFGAWALSALPVIALIALVLLLATRIYSCYEGRYELARKMADQYMRHAGFQNYDCTTVRTPDNGPYVSCITFDRKDVVWRLECTPTECEWKKD